ncbi:ASI1-immunoprecipitated protein 2-like [Miscanthus floridulus]|uniref:ASI1-immunoprecipitated protein 2-like n=1 Tax=Miscanthus floridulus TaxID=154761 RepID=UPI00345B1C62
MNAVCEVCGAIGFERLLLCCSDCKGGHTHQYCLDKVLFHATLEGWFCDECKQRHNEGSHSRSLEKVSSERPSNHARFDSTSQQPITKRLESATVVGTSGQQKRKSTVVGANLKKKHSSRAKSLRKKCIRNKSNMRGKGINRRGIRSKHSSNCTEQLNLSIGQVGSASLSKGVKQPTPVIMNALGYTLGDTGQSHVLKPLEGLVRKSMQTPQSLTTDQVYSTSSLEISSKTEFAHEASATEVEISDTVQNLRKDSPKKRRRLILTDDDEDEEEDKAEDVQQENVNHQPLKCNEPMVKHRINTEYYVEEAVQTGDINDQNLINGRPMKQRRRYIVENEDEEDIEGDEYALNNASKWSSNDSAKMVSLTPVAAYHCHQSRPDSERADQQYHICLQPLDEPVWSGVFKIDNEVFLKLDAHLSNKACQRVHELSGLLQQVVEVRTLSRLQAWPERWISSGPTDESIGLFFLPHSPMQNEDLSRLNRIIKSDDALQVTVGIAELLIFPSVLLPEQYHLFQGKHYLWGVFRQRKDILDNGAHVEEQDGSAHATGEGQHQEHNLLDQQDEALYEVSDKETFDVKHVVDAEDQLQVKGHPEVQNHTMKVATSEGITSLSSGWSPAKPDSSKAGSNSSVHPRTECKLHAPGDAEQQEDFTSSPQWDATSITKQSSAAIPVEHGNQQAHPDSEPSTTKLFGFVTARTPRSQQLIQEMVNEGAVLFPVPEVIAMTDSVTGSSTVVVSSALNPDARCEASQAFDFVSVGHGEPGVDSEACLELFPVRQEQIGWAPRAEVSGEVDLNLSLGKRPPAPSSPPLL